jgi:hypothetical protein
VVGNTVAWNQPSSRQEIEFSDDPLTIAARFANVGAVAGMAAPPMVLDVDLDASSSGRFATVSSVRSIRPGGGPLVPVEFDTAKRERDALGIALALHGTQPRPRKTSVSLDLGAARRRRLGLAQGDVQVALEGWWWTVGNVVEIPLGDQAQASQRPPKIWIGRSDWREQGDSNFSVSLVEAVPLLAVDGAQMAVENNGVLRDSDEMYLLVNRSRQEAIPLSHRVWATRSATVGLRRVDVHSSEWLDRTWREEASLVKITLRREAAFSREVEVAR